jgi:hypothetical protein
VASAVNAGATATPLLFVVAVTVADPAKVPLAPLAGAAKVTMAPLTGLLLAFFTVACSAVGNGVLIVALCGVPAVADMLAGTELVVAARTSTMLRSYRSVVGAVSLMVTLVPLNGVGFVSLWTQ